MVSQYLWTLPETLIRFPPLPSDSQAITSSWKTQSQAKKGVTSLLQNIEITPNTASEFLLFHRLARRGKSQICEFEVKSFFFLLHKLSPTKNGAVPGRDWELSAQKHSYTDRLESGQVERYAALFWCFSFFFFLFLQIPIVLFPGIVGVVQEGLLFRWHGHRFLDALEAIHLCARRRAGHSCLVAVMKAVAKVDHETWNKAEQKTQRHCVLHSLKMTLLEFRRFRSSWPSLLLWNITHWSFR